jgi:hypothetical protein
MAHLLLWFFLFVVGRPQSTEQDVGTKLVWHYTSGTFAGGEVTTYTMGDRRRTEYHSASEPRWVLRTCGPFCKCCNSAVRVNSG